jgi:hypothetical protein
MTYRKKYVHAVASSPTSVFQNVFTASVRFASQIFAIVGNLCVVFISLVRLALKVMIVASRALFILILCIGFVYNHIVLVRYSKK